MIATLGARITQSDKEFEWLNHDGELNHITAPGATHRCRQYPSNQQVPHY